MRAPDTAAVRRPITELDRWLDLEVALENDWVEALKTKMEFHEIDVNTSRWCKECENDYNNNSGCQDDPTEFGSASWSRQVRLCML